MRALILAFAFAALASSASAQAIPAAQAGAPSTSPALLPGAVQFDMISKSTGRSYRIYLYKPQGVPPPPGGFPVLYVLDGDSNFGTAIVQAATGLYDGHSPLLVVGIGYPEGNPGLRRNPDLTPSIPTGLTLAYQEKTAGPTKPGEYGDAEGFHRFMMEEVRPLVTRFYQADPKKQSLMGYSFGGLFALHVLFLHPDAYQSYAIGSPSIWWNDREVLKEEPAFSALVRAGKAVPRILITSGEWEQSEASPTFPAAGPKREEALARMSEHLMVDNARNLAARLKALKGSDGYKVRYTLIPEETHMTGMPVAISRGVSFVTLP